MKRRTLVKHLSHSPLGWMALALGPTQAARAATVMAVRVWPAPDYTRVAIEADAPLQASHFETTNPHRLVIDLQQQELTPELRELVSKIKPDDPYIAGVRIGQFQPGVVRLVVDLKQPIRPQQFNLPPAGNYQHRLVFDLYPEQERDPLQQLAAEHAASTGSAASREDAIASFSTGTHLSGAGGAAAHLSTQTMQQQRSRLGSAAAPADDPLGGLIEKIEQPRQATPPGTRSGAAAPARTSTTRSPSINQLVIVALDPGHGGEDPGATGPSGLREKDVVLSIAQQLRNRINAKPGMRAMMTRDSDFYVPLQDRVGKARKVQADLFISIHADAFTKPTAHGASVFALSTSGASSTTARWLADKENAADMIGGVNARVTRDQHVMRAMLDMSTTAQIRDSMVIGKEVLSKISSVGDLHKPKVEQAGFAVLKAPDIPSILVETAFISNPDEERKLRSSTYQRKLVDALMSGIERYFAKKPPLARRRMA